MLISKKAMVKLEVKEIFSDPNGHFLIVNVKCANKVTTIVNVYGPNEDDPKFFTTLFHKIHEIRAKELIIVGDYNLVLNPELDRSENKQYSPLAHKCLVEYIEAEGLMDLWRIQNENKKTYSWMRMHKGKVSGSRIDMALITQGIANATTQILYEHGYKTDHSLINLQVEFTSNKRGPGYWKFNSKLLHDVNFVKQSNDIIDRVQKNCKNLSPPYIWEYLKDKLRDWAIKRSKQLAEIKRECFKNLQTKITSLQINNDDEANIHNAHQYVLYLEAKIQMEQCLEQEMQNVAFRVRCQFIREGERNTMYFLSQEK